MMTQQIDKQRLKEDIADVRRLLAGRTIALVGLMGAGKSAIGRKVALKLNLPFIDADTEIELSAKMPIADIFESYGEPEFRRLEASVISRIMEEGPKLLATGGGAFMNENTRGLIAQKGVSVWMSAGIDLLMTRVSKKTSRPLLQKPNPRAIMEELIENRYPTYALADVEVASQDVGKDEMAAILIGKLATYLRQEQTTFSMDTDHD